MTTEQPEREPEHVREPRPRAGMSFSFGVRKEPVSSGYTGTPDSESRRSLRMDVTHPEIEPSPFRIVILDEFLGDAPPPRRSVPVTTGSLADVMRDLGVRLTIEVPNRLASVPKDRTVDLRFAALRDLEPEAIVQQVPEFAAVDTLCQRLGELHSGRIDAEQFASELEPVRGMDALLPALDLALEQPEAPPPPATPVTPRTRPARTDEGQRLVDELFDMVAVPGEEERAPSKSEALDSAIASITGATREASGSSARAKELFADVLAQQVLEVVRHPRFRALERAWRSLQFILAQADPRSRNKVHVELLHASPREFGEVFTNCVYGPECTGETEHPLALTVLGWPIRNNAAELETLGAVQQQAEELQAPVLWSMEPSFLGMDVRALAAREQVRSVLDRDELAKWRGLRGDDAARWSGACLNRFLLREPYGDGRPERLPLVEKIDDPEDHLWGAPSCFVAGLIARSVAETGWPTRFTGPRAGGVTGGPLAGGKPTEAALSESTVEDLADGGIMALTCTRDRDEAFLLRAPSVHAPARYGTREALNAASRAKSALPFQLLAARIAELTLRHKTDLIDDWSTEGVRRRFELFLGGLVGDTGPGAGAEVEVEQDPKDPMSLSVHCTVRTGKEILGGTEVQFSLRATSRP